MGVRRDNRRMDMNTEQAVEETMEEFNERLFANTIEHDSWLHLQIEDRNCTCHIDDKEMEDWLRSTLTRIAEEARKEERERMLKLVKEQQ